MTDFQSKVDQLREEIRDRVNPLESEIAYAVEVPPDERDKMADICTGYALEVGSEIPAGCVLYGLIRGKWHANVSARWLLLHLLKERQPDLFCGECEAVFGVRDGKENICDRIEFCPFCGCEDLDYA